jgi:hypothetical protein
MTSESSENKVAGPLSFKRRFIRNALGIWAVTNVLAILGNALKRLFPVAMQPFVNKDILPYHYAMYAIWSLYMAYAEGYKAFHLKFAPMVVNRAFHLHENKSLLNIVLAGPYSMGLFAASRKRMIVSWSITAGVFALISVVKHLPYPYRSIIDGGVVVGLSLGTASIVWNTIGALFGKIPKVEDDEKKTK